MTFYSKKIPSLLREIKRKGSKLVMATDNMDTFRRFTIPGMQLDSLFDDYLISCELGVLKEDIKKDSLLFFDHYLQENGLDHADTVLLDDSTDETGFYDQKGMKILEINQPKKIIEFLQYYAFHNE